MPDRQRSYLSTTASLLLGDETSATRAAGAASCRIYLLLSVHREDLLVVGAEQTDEQRLRASAGERRSLHLRGDEAPDGEAFGSLMRISKQFQKVCSRKSIYRIPD